jgi:hypothetical protein
MLSIGHRAAQRMELTCTRCGHPLVLKPGDLLKPCTACMHIEFRPRRRAPASAAGRAAGTVHAAQFTERAERFLDLHAAWLAPHQRETLARALAELLAEVAEQRNE